MRAKLPSRPPAGGDGVEQWLSDIDEIVMPGITHWQSPNFFAFFPANASGPAILGDLLAAGLGVQGMLWATSPACTEVETHVLDWLVGMLGLPERFRSDGAGGGVIQDTASSASLCALLAARERVTGLASNEHGVGGRRLVAYTSDQAHSSIEKAVKIAGIGRENLRLVPVDADFAMRPDALAEAIAADRAAGALPFFVCATVGTTSSTAIDPVRAIGEICARESLWLHVDGAHSGSAALAPELRWVNDGLELADSYCFNPHKWMLTNFDCDCMYVADRAALINALQRAAGVPAQPGDGVRRGVRLPGLARAARAPLPRAQALVRHPPLRRGGPARARPPPCRPRPDLRGPGWKSDARFELAAPAPLSLVCFRHRGGDEANQRLLDELNASGRLYLTHTRLDSKLTLRMAIGSTGTEQRHVEAAWHAIRELAPD